MRCGRRSGGRHGRRCELKAAEAEIDREHEEREAKRREQEEQRRKLREETEERARAEQVWRERERAIRRAVARAEVPAEVSPAPAAERRPPEPAEVKPAAPAKAPVPAPTPAKAPAPAPVSVKISEERKADVRVGDEVIVTRGFLRGRSGVVHGIEEKGDLKVAFGSLTARVPRDDVQGQGPPAPQGDENGRRRGRHGNG